MLNLFASNIKPLGSYTKENAIARISTNSNLPSVVRPKHILLLTKGATVIPEGFRAVFFLNQREDLTAGNGLRDVFQLPADQEYLEDGDIVRFNPTDLSMRTLYRRSSNHNSLLVTERCNHYCLMCSQPPQEIDDSYIVDELLQAIPLMDRRTREIGITGGEPTLLGKSFVKLIETLKNYLPNTATHVLSNGRTFASKRFTQSVADIHHPDLMIGIPIYSDVSHHHNYVVQADNAFDQTIKGILNLKTYGQKVEIRVVIHKQTYDRLPQLARFIARNLLFVDHVALMGLEMMGFTPMNLDELWIDPVDYQNKLVEAVETLSRCGMRVSIYNHQLCLLDPRLWPFSIRSISDWKNEYMPECSGCQRKSECAGFFSSARVRYSDHIKPFGTKESMTLSS